MGGDEGPEHMKAHRLVNSWEFAKLARQAADVGRYVIAAVDFNSVPTAVPMTWPRKTCRGIPVNECGAEWDEAPHEEQ